VSDYSTNYQDPWNSSVPSAAWLTLGPNSISGVVDTLIPLALYTHPTIDDLYYTLRGTLRAEQTITTSGLIDPSEWVAIGQAMLGGNTAGSSLAGRLGRVWANGEGYYVENRVTDGLWDFSNDLVPGAVLPLENRVYLLRQTSGIDVTGWQIYWRPGPGGVQQCSVGGQVGTLLQKHTEQMLWVVASSDGQTTEILHGQSGAQDYINNPTPWVPKSLNVGDRDVIPPGPLTCCPLV
jgi:hypothetical protein